MAIMFRGGPADGQTAPEPGDPSGTDDPTQQGGGGIPDFQAGVDEILRVSTETASKPGASEADKLLVQKIMSFAQQLKAQFEKEKQAALGGGPATQYLTRATGGGG